MALNWIQGDLIKFKKRLSNGRVVEEYNKLCTCCKIIHAELVQEAS